MNRAKIVQIMFGIGPENMDKLKDLLRTDCKFDESDISPLHIRFWIDTMSEKEWKDCISNFRILHDIYSIAYDRGYLEGVRRQHELESGGKEYE